jgi:SAM-dependent methyltransferase
VSDLWDAQAASFDDEPDHGLRNPQTRAAWLALLTEHLPPTPARVADLGCGTGSLSILLADAGYAVDGVDYSPAMVERVVAKADGRTDVTFRVADAATPPLEPASYDAVLCRHVLWALPDPGAALAAWLDLLKPAGRLLLVEGSWHTGAGLSAEETVALVRAAGRTPGLHLLTDRLLWGGPIDDERYLVVA